MKEQVTQILLQKKDSNMVAKNMLEFIDYFTEAELSDILLILTADDAEKKKEILLKNLSEYEETINEIIKIGLKFERIKTIMMYEAVRKQSRESLSSLKSSLGSPQTI